jgi:multiple sugar transport system permease protein
VNWAARWPSGSRAAQERRAAIVLMAPAVIGLLLFVVLPITSAFAISFLNWSGLSSPTFAGLSNYQALLDDPKVPRSFLTTATFAIGYVLGLYLFSLGLALIVSQRVRGSRVFRSAYILPLMVSPAVAAVIWRYVFDERSGFLNGAIGALGFEPISWLGTQQLALLSIVIVNVWQAVGYMTIIQLAGLQDIPREYYDAAEVDGADARASFRFITFPLLRPTTAFVLVVGFIDALQVFDVAFVLTRGGPAGATTTAVMYIYRQGFEFLNFGYASAIAVVLFAIIFTLSFILLRVFRQFRIGYES